MSGPSVNGSPDHYGRYGSTSSSSSSSAAAMHAHQPSIGHSEPYAPPGAYPLSPRVTGSLASRPNRDSGRTPNDIDSPPILPARISPSYTSRSSPWSPPSPKGEELPYLRPSPAGSSSSSPPRPRHRLDGGEWISRTGTGISQEAGPSTSPPRSGGIPGSPNHGYLGKNRGMKRRPSPLDLRGGVGEVRVDPELQEHLDDIASAVTVVTDDSSLSDELQDLSLLRDTIHRNLRDRPVHTASPSRSGFGTPSAPDNDYPDRQERDMTDIPELLEGMKESEGLVLVDTRPLGDYLDRRLPRSANISIPTLIFKRIRKGVGPKMDWKALESFVTAPEGKEIWSAAQKGDRVVLIGSSGWDDVARSLLPILQGVHNGRVKLLRGGWQAVEADPQLTGLVQIAPQSENIPARPAPPLRSATLPTPSRSLLTTQSNPPESTFNIAPPTPPTESLPRLSNQISMPSLRAKRGQPGLVLQTGTAGKRPPKLSLNVDRPLRSATVGSFSKSPTALKSPGFLKIDTTMGNGLTSSPTAASFNNSFSVEGIAHTQSPSSFSNMQAIGQEDSIQAGPSRSLSPRPTTRNGYTEPEHIPRTAVMTARHAMSPFIVSTILPGFLFLGPEITNDEDVNALRRLGVKRILNVAMECDDESELGLKRVFERYLKIPMRDTVEESGVGKGMNDACDFLDDARLHSAPTYVHCKAGKSRSVTVVLAYLIHANAWTLKTAYAYVAERRKGISPNIGFVAELMQFEERELGVKQSGGVHGENGQQADMEDERKRYARESLPPAWGSLDSTKPVRMDLAENGGGDEKDKRKVDEREVRKNGQWVHQRRVPVDRSTLQPGRRASKAGLESLRTLASISSPKPSPSVSGAAATPSVDGRLGWI